MHATRADARLSCYCSPATCGGVICDVPGDCCIKANRCVAFGIRLWSHTEVCSLQTSPSAPCASSFLQSQDNLASKIVRLLTFATVLYNMSKNALPRGGAVTARGDNAMSELACSAHLPPISLRNDAKVQHGITPKCIKVYRNVLNCIVTYPNVSKCIKLYRSVSNCIEVYRNVSKCIETY